MIPFEEALEAVVKAARNTANHIGAQKTGAENQIYGETLPVGDALGRYLLEDIASPYELPQFNRAAMDGYAIKNSDYTSGLRDYILTGKAHAGVAPEIEKPNEFGEPGSAVEITTGAAVPSPYDKVVKVEECSLKEEGGQTMVRVGEDPKLHIEPKGNLIQVGGALLKKGTRLDRSAMHALALWGKERVLVGRLPSAAVVATGSELSAAGEALPAGGGSANSANKIIDTNSFAIEAFLREAGISPAFMVQSGDDREGLRRDLGRAIEEELVIVTGGVSAGAADYVPGILGELGVERVFHKVAIKPGKPLWFGVSPKGGLVFGLPGNPLAVTAGLRVFVEPALRILMGEGEVPHDVMGVLAPLAAGRKKKSGRGELFPVALDSAGMLTSLETKGSSDIVSICGAHGLALHPLDKPELGEGELVRYFAW